MGSSQSSPSPSASTKHVFSSTTPVQFSQELIDSLQASSETNSTRAKTLDLHIQQRVAAELATLQAAQSERLAAVKTEIARSDPATKSLFSGADADADKGPSSQAVRGSIEALRRELDARKRVGGLPRELERAREDVVGCLRVNDRRPLDCWREVEGFKREVRRLEEEFVGRVL